MAGTSDKLRGQSALLSPGVAVQYWYVSGLSYYTDTRSSKRGYPTLLATRQCSSIPAGMVLFTFFVDLPDGIWSFSPLISTIFFSWLIASPSVLSLEFWAAELGAIRSSYPLSHTCHSRLSFQSSSLGGHIPHSPLEHPPDLRGCWSLSSKSDRTLSRKKRE